MNQKEDAAEISFGKMGHFYLVQRLLQGAETSAEKPIREDGKSEAILFCLMLTKTEGGL